MCQVFSLRTVVEAISSAVRSLADIEIDPKKDRRTCEPIRPDQLLSKDARAH